MTKEKVNIPSYKVRGAVVPSEPPKAEVKPKAKPKAKKASTKKK